MVDAVSPDRLKGILLRGEKEKSALTLPSGGLVLTFIPWGWVRR